jgi:hypothetical protein
MNWFIEFKNKIIIFFGDSAMLQVWEAVVCAMLTANEGEIVYERSTHATPPRGFATFHAFNLSVDYRGFYLGRYDGNMLRNIEQSHHIVLVSFGLHYNKYPGKNIREIDDGDYFNHMQLFLLDCQAMLSNI